MHNLIPIPFCYASVRKRVPFTSVDCASLGLTLTYLLKKSDETNSSLFLQATPAQTKPQTLSVLLAIIAAVSGAGDAVIVVVEDRSQAGPHLLAFTLQT